MSRALRKTKQEEIKVLIYILGKARKKQNKKKQQLTPVELLERSVPNCAGPAVSTTLPKNGCETI